MTRKRFPTANQIYRSILVEALSDWKQKWETKIEMVKNGKMKFSDDRAIEYIAERVEIGNEMLIHYSEK